jgi:methionyl-tRNA synthetase
MHSPKRYLVTSALPYANGPLHVGHLAGAYLPADIFVRYLRMMGKDVVYVCGSDEHGAAITMRAKKEGIGPQEIVDKYHDILKNTFKDMGISFDIYHRTSSKLHHETSQEIFKILFEKGAFEEKVSMQYFDEEAQQFLADRYIVGTCPVCANPDAYGDQCEKCGSTLSPTDLINPRSALSGGTPILKETSHWYLPLNAHEDWLRNWLETGMLDGVEHHDVRDWKDHILGQCRSWLDGGLQPRAMTRDLDWGVDVPQDIPNSLGKKLYVWLDAPIGYISATRQWALDNNKDWKDYWQDDESHLIHFLAKDNIVFHCLIFPAILKATGGYNLPVNVPGNQFVNLEGKKISTSRNWAVWVHEYLEDFPDGQDLLRYNMVKNMPEQKDSEFTWKNFQETSNNELVNNLANFVNRVLVLSHKYYGGIVPDFDPEVSIEGINGDDLPSFFDVELLDLFDLVSDAGESIRNYNFREALTKVMEISSVGNRILQSNEPWKKTQTNPEEVKVVIALSVQVVMALSVVVRPFMPFTSDKIRSMLGLPVLESDNNIWMELNEALSDGQILLEPGHKLGEAAHLFSRIPDEVIEAQIKKLNESDQNIPVEENNNIQYPPLAESISFDDFSKLDLRIGHVLSAEKVDGADKLLKLSVDLGFETRTIVSGIALHFSPAEMVGKKVVVVANLAPRMIRKVESKGMILFAENSEGKLVSLEPAAEATPGFQVK